jgi:hypothetical protein
VLVRCGKRRALARMNPSAGAWTSWLGASRGHDQSNFRSAVRRALGRRNGLLRQGCAGAGANGGAVWAATFASAGQRLELKGVGVMGSDAVSVGPLVGSVAALHTVRMVLPQTAAATCIGSFVGRQGLAITGRSCGRATRAAQLQRYAPTTHSLSEPDAGT